MENNIAYEALSSTIKTYLEDLASEFNTDSITVFNHFDEYLGYEYDKEIDRYSYRWWDDIVVQKQIGNSIYQWTWATANRDESLFDLGWEFDWNSLKLVPFEDTIDDTQRLDFLQNNMHNYGKGWILRKSSTNRGLRLHETSQEGAVKDVRQAIDNYIAQQKEKTNG